MQDTNKDIDLQIVKNECAKRVDSFFKRFRIENIAKNSQIKKAKGYSAVSILQSIFILPFIGQNIYWNIVINPDRETSSSIQ